MKVSRTSVNKWIRIYLNEGLGGLQEKPRSGRPAYLTEAQMEQLSQYIKKNAIKPSGGRLTGADIHHHINNSLVKTIIQTMSIPCLKDLTFHG